MRSYPPAILTRALVLTAALAAALPALALVIPDKPGRFSSLVIQDPSASVTVATVPLESSAVPEAVGSGWKTWLAQNGRKGSVILDARSGAPLNVETSGIPWITGGRITAAEGREASAAPVAVTLDSLAASLKTFVSRNASLLRANPAEMVLNSAGSGEIAPDLWQVEFDRQVGGVPVLDDRYIFSIGHGNLIAFGASRWSDVSADAAPTLSPADARTRLLEYMGVTAAERIDIIEDGTLLFAPAAPANTSSEAFSGPLGSGYQSELVYRIVVSVEGDEGTWVSLVDARTGAILAFYDDNKYARIKGGVFPVSNDGICPSGCEQADYPLPFAAMTVNGGAVNASSAGAFNCSGGSASTSLNGQYVKVVDNCGLVNQSVACSADLDFSASSGTDCTVPAGSSAGNTHAARTSFYHLNRIKEHARAWLPANSWLPGNLTDNININMTCNAFWSSGGATGTVNFYRSGGGCRNTGEIAGIFLHEWGHGMDQNDGGGYDRPTEGYADITALLSTHVSCVGRGFQTPNCSDYGNACLNCTGVRDQDWNQRANHTPSTMANFGSPNCPNTGYDTVCGTKDGHCIAHIPAETIWDLAVRDLPAAGIDQNTSWQIVDRLWYNSRTGSGGAAFACTIGPPVTSNGCAATHWFNKLRTVDDDDGNLANGTPHGAAIFAAFNRHLIACGAAGDASNQSTSGCPAIGTPTVTVTPGGGSASLSWTAVANAASYNILRTDQGCSSGFTIVANVAGTSYTDTNLAAGFPEYYSVQALGSNASCLGALSTCQTVTPLAGADLSVTMTDSPDPVTAGANITYTITATNAGPDAAASAVMTSATPANTTFVSLAAASGWTCTTPSVGGTGAISCTRASYPASTPSAFTLVVKVNSCIGNGSVGGSASVSSATSDPVPANNNASTTTTVNDPGTCSDGNACTIGDTCVGSVCQPGAPVVCTASDQCHDAGTCNPGTGVCSNPAKQNGSVCNDGNACTQTDTCQTGVCTGSNPVSCTASDQCHNAGTCNPATGVCSDPAKPNGSACSDGNGCTQPDVCQAGVCTAGAPVVCTASDQCHDPGTCNPGTGTCSNPAKPNGSACSDGNACTQTDTCQAGACAGSNPVSCTASDQCHNAGTCNPATGVCSDPAKPNGSGCTDGNACTQTDTCQAGACVGSNPIVCTASDQCHDAGSCDSGTGACSNPAKPNGSACNDGNACTQTDTCQSGACAGSNPVVCSASDQCHDAGSCDTGTGVCSNPPKPDETPCDDNNQCTGPDLCKSGVCVPTGPGTCYDDANPCTDDSCDPILGCLHIPNDANACSDGDACTIGDACQFGACQPGAPAPPPNEVNDTLMVTTSGPNSTISWNDGSGPFNVYRGNRGSLPWAYNQQCLARQVPGPVADATLPAVSETYYYLVSRTNPTCGTESITGRDSDGTPDPNGSPCP